MSLPSSANSDITVEDVTCPACFEIFSNPVTLPCKHSVCYDCLHKTVDNNRFQCLVCRKYISAWLRTNKDKLVDIKLKNRIDKKFPDRNILDRNEGNSTADMVERALSPPGKIKEEFDEELQKHRIFMEEYIKNWKEEEEEGLPLAQHLQNEETVACVTYESLLTADELFARSLQRKIYYDQV